MPSLAAESHADVLPTRERALVLLRGPNFRRAYLAIAVSVLGDAFHYIALMWVALVTAGPLGVLAVRLADSVPAFVFGFHGGAVGGPVGGGGPGRGGGAVAAGGAGPGGAGRARH